MRPLVKVFFLLLLVAQLLSGAIGSAALAHEVRPSIVDLTVLKDGNLKLAIRLNLEAVIAGIGVEHTDTSQSANAGEYDRLRQLSREALNKAFNKTSNGFKKAIGVKVDGVRLGLEISSVDIPEVGDTDLSRLSIINLHGKLSGGAKSLVWVWDKKLGAAIVRVKGAAQEGNPVFAGLVKGGTESGPIALTGMVPLSALSIFGQYIKVGIEHIIPKGLDHILFVVGLFLLSSRFSSLLWQISSFTIAHTITLGLAMAGFISAPSGFVEPLIALSIVYVAVENIFTSKLNHWRTLVVFMFGLLHGLGFASVLNDVGLPTGSFFSALIGFNIGVEIGQLSVVAICFFLVGWWFRDKTYYRKLITIPASALIAVIGAWWFIERTLL